MNGSVYYVVKAGFKLDEKIGMFSNYNSAIDLAEKMKSENGSQYQVYSIGLVYTTQTLEEALADYKTG